MLEDVKFETTDKGCIVPTNRKLSYDGYYKVNHPTKRRACGRKCCIAYHRLLWELKYGEVPEGYALHHKCHNRACCNTDHLVLMTITDHSKLHNDERYGDRKERAKKYWLQNRCTGTSLSRLFGVSDSMGCRWVRGWKKEIA